MKLCRQCGKRIASGRMGSLTQWVFRTDQCSCDRQLLGSLPPAPAEENPEPEPALIEEEPELALDPNSFPLTRYKPVAVIGKGASSTVYLCRDRLLGKKVAVKCLRSTTAELLVSFQLEAKATSLINHPNIVTILDFGSTDSGAPYMVMQYVKGVSLEELISTDGPLEPVRAVRLFGQICDALAMAHSKGIFHRDVKPSNILLVDGSFEKPIIIDFGIAKIKQQHQEPTIVQGNTIAGTPFYMPPDQAFGLPYSQASEVYALGCVIFETLAGRPPFSGESALDTMNLHATQPPERLDEIGDIPEPLADIVSNCLAKRIENRIASMDEVKQALIGLLQSEPGDTQLPVDKVDDRPSRASTFNRSKYDNLLPVAITILIVIAAAYKIVDTYYSELETNRAREKRDREADEEREALSSQLSFDELAPGAFQLRSTSRTVLERLAQQPKVEQLELIGSGVDFKEALGSINQATLRSLLVRSLAFKNDDLVAAKGLKNLEKICIQVSSEFDGSGLAHIENLPISKLVLDHVPVRDTSLIDLRKFTKLRDLQILSTAPIEDLYFKGSKLRNLDQPFERIHLSSTGMLDEHALIALVDRMRPRLRSAALGSNTIYLATSDLPHVNDLLPACRQLGPINVLESVLTSPNLQSLRIASDSRAATVIKRIHKPAGLRVLSVYDSPLPAPSLHEKLDADFLRTPIRRLSLTDLKPLINKNHLRELSLYGSLSPEEYKYLGAMKSLESLSVQNSRATDEDIALLSGMNLVTLDLRNCLVTTDGIIAASGAWPRMKKLRLSSPYLKQDTAKRLLKSLPDCSITTEP